MSGQNFTYFIINLASIAIPLAASFEHRIRFFSQWRYWIIAISIPGILFIIWDIFFTRWGVWGFNEMYITGTSLFGLPLEEWMFFFCIPYACLFTYAALKHLIPNNISSRYTGIITGCLVVLMLLVLLFNTGKAYTVTTFGLLIIVLLLHQWWVKSNYLGRFYFTYLFILIPFLLVNGILTGSFIEQEVVWYNNDENLGLRIFTIPLEDAFYGMLLILMNVTIYEFFRNRKTKPVAQ